MSITLRTHHSSDIPWIINRHGTLYANEYGWNENFTSLCAQIATDFDNSFDPAWERCWIAEDAASSSFSTMLNTTTTTTTTTTLTTNNVRDEDNNNSKSLGCIMLVRDTEPHTAKLRLLLVEPSARGRGVGSALIKECLRFAREVGYRRVVLWTQSVLVGARRLYHAEGFRLVKTEEHDGFGVKLVGEFWELVL